MDLREALVRETGDAELVDGYYLPVARFCLGAGSTTAQTPRFVGISGPQGCGKSTLAGHLVSAFGAVGLRAVAVSIDDFYLTHDAQRALAARHAGNRYLEHRGYPGTHDVALGSAVLHALAAHGAGEVRVPVYDKGAFGGRGDRAPETAWRSVRTPLDLVLLEGWKLGFTAVPPESLDDVALRVANAHLPRYDAWLSRLAALVHLDAPDLAWVVRWRVDAERARREATGVGLADDEARDYVERFLPAYRTYVPGLRARPPVSGPVLRVELGPDRRGRVRT